MEVKINREIRNYTESMFFGLSLRQFVFSILALGIATQKENCINVNSFVALVRKHTDIQELNAEVIREFVERVEVFQPVRVGGRKVQRLRIVWNCIGEFTPPQP